MPNRGTLYAGTMLILLGIIFLLLTTADWFLGRMDINFQAWSLWPLIILFVSVAFWTPIFIWWRDRQRVIGLAVPASIFLVLGLLLLYQSLSGNWGSWAYAWALIPFSVGLGLFAMYALGLPEARNSGLLWSSIVVGAVGLFFFVLFGSFFGGTLIRLVAPFLLILVGVAVLGGSFWRR
jgi:hypothetical protein